MTVFFNTLKDNIGFEGLLLGYLPAAYNRDTCLGKPNSWHRNAFTVTDTIGAILKNSNEKEEGEIKGLGADVMAQEVVKLMEDVLDTGELAVSRIAEKRGKAARGGATIKNKKRNNSGGGISDQLNDCLIDLFKDVPNENIQFILRLICGCFIKDSQDICKFSKNILQLFLKKDITCITDINKSRERITVFLNSIWDIVRGAQPQKLEASQQEPEPDPAAEPEPEPEPQQEQHQGMVEATEFLSKLQDLLYSMFHYKQVINRVGSKDLTFRPNTSEGNSTFTKNLRDLKMEKLEFPNIKNYRDISILIIELLSCDRRELCTSKGGTVDKYDEILSESINSILQKQFDREVARRAPLCVLSWLIWSFLCCGSGRQLLVSATK